MDMPACHTHCLPAHSMCALFLCQDIRVHQRDRLALRPGMTDIETPVSMYIPVCMLGTYRLDGPWICVEHAISLYDKAPNASRA